MWKNKINVFFLCFVSLAIFACGNKKDGEGNEKYDQVVVSDTTGDESGDSVHIPQNKRTIASQLFIDSSKLKFRYTDETKFDVCVITDMIFDLIENTDQTVQLALKANGIVSEENGYRINCFFYPTVPWNPDEPSDLPYSWIYADEHLRTGTKAQYHSRTNTRLVLVKESLTDPSFNEVLYPIPGEIDDPPNAVITGSTTLLQGTKADFDDEISIWMNSSFSQTDQSGNTIEVQFEMSTSIANEKNDSSSEETK